MARLRSQSLDCLRPTRRRLAKTIPHGHPTGSHHCHCPPMRHHLPMRHHPPVRHRRPMRCRRHCRYGARHLSNLNRLTTPHLRSRRRQAWQPMQSRTKRVPSLELHLPGHPLGTGRGATNVIAGLARRLSFHTVSHINAHTQFVANPIPAINEAERTLGVINGS